MSRADRFEFTLDEDTEKRLYDLLTSMDTRNTNRVLINDKYGYHAEYVKVIKCENCKFWNRHDGTFPDFDDKKWHECKQLYPFTTASGDSAVTPSWFYCGYAERKEE